MSESLMRRATPDQNAVLRQANADYMQLQSHMAGIAFPPPVFEPMGFDAPDFEGGFDMGAPEFNDDSYLDMSFEADLFFMGLGQDIRDEASFKEDGESREFLDGKKKEQELKEKEQKEWAKKHEKELKKQGVKVIVAPDGTVKLVNENSPPPEIVSSGEFRDFMAGKQPEYSGKGAEAAKWLAENKERLAGLGITVRVQGEDFTVENTRMKNAALDQKAFAGSGFGGPDFKSFLAGAIPTFNGNDKGLAGWLADNMQALEKAGVFVHVELDADGSPKGGFSLQNRKIPLAPDVQKKALRELVRDTKRAMADAKSALLKARDLKAGNPAESKKLKDQGLARLANARFQRNVISKFVSFSRMLKAEKSGVKRLPPAYQNLLKKMDGFPASAKTAGERLLAIRKSAFIAELAHTRISLAGLGSKAQLKAGDIKKIDGFLNSAIRMFEKSTPESFEKAQLILTIAREHVSISLERRAARLDSLEAKHIDFYASVEGDPLFRTGGKFDPEKFRQLTGVPYGDFKAKAGRLLPGFARVLSHYSTKAVSHYDLSLRHLESVLALAESAQPPDMRKAVALLGMASRERAGGRKQHAQLYRIKPLIAASAELYSAMARLPSVRRTESDTSGWRLGPQGKNDLVALRKTVQENYAATVTCIYKAALCLLASQNSKEGEAHAGQAKAFLKRAQAANIEFQKSAAMFHTHYSLTKAIATQVQNIGSKAYDDAAQGESAVDGMQYYLGKLIGDPVNRPRFEAIFKSYYTRTITNPNTLATAKWPRGELLREHIKAYMGWENYRALYDEKSTPAQLKAAATRILNLTVDVEKSVTTGNEKGQISTTIIVKEKMGDHLQKHSSRIPIYNTLKGVKEGKALTPEKRRELLLEFLRLGGNMTMVGALGRVDSGFEDALRSQFRNDFLKRVTGLRKQLAEIKNTGKDISRNGNFILENLRPKDVYFESGIGGGPRVRFANPKVADAYRKLEADAAYVAPIVGDMSEFLPDMDESLRLRARNLLLGVAEFQAKRQKYIEHEERTQRLVMAGTIVGTLIMMPFVPLIGATGIGAFSFIATGTTLGSAAPAVIMAYKKYKMAKKDPNVPQSGKNKAYEDFRKECILGGLVTIPFLGYAGRTFAASRGALRLASTFAGFESLGIVSAYLGYEQYKLGMNQVSEGEFGWGAFNLAFGGIGFASGVLGPISSFKDATALHRPKVPGAPATAGKPVTQPARNAAGADSGPGAGVARPEPPGAPAAPGRQAVQPPRESAGPNPVTKPDAPAKPTAQPREEVPGPKARPGGEAVQPKPPAAPAAATPAERMPANITNLEEANIVLRDSKTLTDAQAGRIKAAQERIVQQIKSGVKLTPQQADAYREFRKLLNLTPAADAIELRQFHGKVAGNQNISVKNVASAIAARQKLLNVGRLRPLESTERSSLALFEAAIAAQKDKDLKALSAFNSRFSGTPYNPSKYEKSIAGLAYERLALLDKQSLTPAEAAVLSAHRSLMGKFEALKVDLGSAESLTGFVNDLRSANQGIRSSATAEFNRLPEGVKGQVRALLQHFTANNLWSARSREQQIAAAKEYAERIKQLKQ